MTMACYEGIKARSPNMWWIALLPCLLPTPADLFTHTGHRDEQVSPHWRTSNTDWEEGRELMKSVRVGMTEEQVRAILGEPSVHFANGTFSSTMIYSKYNIEI